MNSNVITSPDAHFTVKDVMLKSVLLAIDKLVEVSVSPPLNVIVHPIRQCACCVQSMQCVSFFALVEYTMFVEFSCKAEFYMFIYMFLFKLNS